MAMIDENRGVPNEALESMFNQANEKKAQQRSVLISEEPKQIINNDEGFRPMTERLEKFLKRTITRPGK